MAELRGALIGCGLFAVNQMHGWQDCEGASGRDNLKTLPLVEAVYESAMTAETVYPALLLAEASPAP